MHPAQFCAKISDLKDIIDSHIKGDVRAQPPPVVRWAACHLPVRPALLGLITCLGNGSASPTGTTSVAYKALACSLWCAKFALVCQIVLGVNKPSWQPQIIQTSVDC